MMFEIFTLFVPAVQVIRLWIQNKKAVCSNNKWETSSQTSTLHSSTIDWKLSSLSIAEKGKPLDITDGELGDRIITMKALEHVLSENPAPLLEFSALNDFSGENIAFLTRVSRWKTTWPGAPTKEETLVVYNAALEIYTDFISPTDAQFPLNLPSSDLKQLEKIFEKPARILRGAARVNPATPFDIDPDQYHGRGANPDTELGGFAQYTGEVPGEFDEGVFDSVQNHIKYLVLTNTWPKFIAEMQSRRRSSETGRSVVTAGSKATVTSRISTRVAELLRSIF